MPDDGREMGMERYGMFLFDETFEIHFRSSVEREVIDIPDARSSFRRTEHLFRWYCNIRSFCGREILEPRYERAVDVLCECDWIIDGEYGSCCIGQNEIC